MKIKLLTVTFLLFFCGMVNATSYNVTDVERWDENGSFGYYIDAGDHISWTHVYQFDPALNSILDGALSVVLTDDGGRNDFIELALGVTESGNWFFGEVGMRFPDRHRIICAATQELNYSPGNPNGRMVRHNPYSVKPAIGVHPLGASIRFLGNLKPEGR